MKIVSNAINILKYENVLCATESPTLIVGVGGVHNVRDVKNVKNVRRDKLKIVWHQITGDKDN